MKKHLTLIVSIFIILIVSVFYILEVKDRNKGNEDFRTITVADTTITSRKDMSWFNQYI